MIFIFSFGDIKVSEIRICIIFLLATLFLGCKEDEKGPICKIITPKSDETFFIGENIEISINANDPDGLIDLVTIQIDGDVVSEAEIEPYNYSWSTKGESVGQHTITAIATDNSGLSDMVSINIMLTAESPELETLPISFTGTTTAISGIRVVSNGIPGIVQKGVCWNSKGDPTINDNIILIEETGLDHPNGQIPALVKGLDLDTKYYIRAFADNGVSITYGETLTTTTAKAYFSETGFIIDLRDQNKYDWVKIGNQTWFSQNLVYNEGLGYPYGYLYYHQTILSTDIKLCPDGWHLPSSSEWAELINFVGGEKIAGGILKESGTNNWKSPNTAASDKANFSALPGGQGYSNAGLIIYSDQYEKAVFWTSDAKEVVLRYDLASTSIQGGPSNSSSLNSCRCVKD